MTARLAVRKADSNDSLYQRQLVDREDEKKSIPSDQKPKIIKWAFPDDYQFRDKGVKELIDSIREVSLCKVALPQGRVAKSSLIAKVVWNVASHVLCCRPEDRKPKKNEMLHAATLLLHQRAWSYKHNPKDLENLRNEAPWKGTHYAKAQSMLEEARKDLFAGTEGESSAVQVSITTPDKVTLDGIFYPSKSKQVILLVMGLTAMYEECAVDFVYKNFVSFFKKEFNNPNILLVNTRGIGLSEGFTTPQSLQVDIFTAYQFLVKQYGFDVENVIPWGHSLGGCYGLQGAALMQLENPDKKVSAVVERTFLKFTDVPGKVAGTVLAANGVELDSQKAADTLKGSLVTIVSKKDSIIPYPVSFAKKYKPQQQQNYTVIELEDDSSIKPDKNAALTMKDHHIRAFRPGEVKQIKEALKNVLH